MKGMILTADAASMDSNGKISMLGGFWTSVGEGPTRMDVVVSIRLLPSELGRHGLAIALDRLDGEPSGPVFAVQGELAIEAPASEVPQAEIAANQILNLPPVSLAAGVYKLSLKVDDVLLDEWAFVVAPRLNGPDTGEANSAEG